jgi:DNA-binding PadR family transcriptional regulator
MSRQDRQRPNLGEFEQIVLLAVLRLGPHASGPTVRRELDRQAGRAASRGALYRTFDRLEAKGLLNWTLEPDGGGDRDGHPLRRFEVTESGLRSLRQSREVLLNLWDGLEALLNEPSR